MMITSKEKAVYFTIAVDDLLYRISKATSPLNPTNSHYTKSDFDNETAFLYIRLQSLIIRGFIYNLKATEEEESEIVENELLDIIDTVMRYIDSIKPNCDLKSDDEKKLFKLINLFGKSLIYPHQYTIDESDIEQVKRITDC